MTKLQKVLVAYDGSPQSKDALYWAIYFSRRTGAAVSAVKVFEPILRETGVDEVGTLPEKLFEKYSVAQKEDIQLMEAVKELGREQEVEITTAVLAGHVSQTLLDYAKKKEIDMIVTGTRGHGTLKQLLLGSVTHGLVSAADIPVMVVKKCPIVEYTGKSLCLTHVRKIMVAYDGFPQSQAALTWAFELARLTDARVSVVKVFEPFQMGLAYSMAESGSAERVTAKLQEIEETNTRQMAEVKAKACEYGVEVDTHITSGSILETLLDFTEKNRIDLIAVGARGLGILDKLPVGSVPHGLISLSPVPVLVVKK